MQSRMIVTAVLLSLFIITVETNAEMRISPDGVTFPDNSTQITAVSGGGISAPLHLRGSFSTGDPTESPVGATISGVNTKNEIVSLSGPGATGNMLQFKAGGHVLGFQPNKAYLAGLDHALSIEFLGTPGVMPTAASSASTTGNMTSAPTLSTVLYQNLWEGISLTYESTKDGITESTYQIAPGGDISKIRLRYNVPMELQADGSLKFKFDKGYLIESSPVAWQEIGGKRVPVTVAFRLSDGEVGFRAGQHDLSYPLTIDPIYVWNSFFGPSSGDVDGLGIAVDSSGNVYVTGYSYGTWGFPLNAYSGNSDIFVLKLSSSGAVQWNTFFGSSSGYDAGNGIAVDSSGNVYVTGYSYGTWGFPLNAYSGDYDIFVLKLSSSGAVQWNTFFGSSSGYDVGNGIAVDSGGNVYVTGYSNATWGSPLNAYSGDDDIFVLKLNSSGAVQWNTFFGSSSGYDVGNGIAVDSGGNIYVTGTSNATWGFPLNAYSGGYDIFVLKLSGSGAVQWNTFFGSSSGYDGGNGIAVDSSGNVYVTGASNATWGSPLNAYSGESDIFVLKLSSSGAFQWNTFFGSSNGYDNGKGIAVDSSGNVYVTGYSNATWGFPLNAYSGDYDIFVLKLSSSGPVQWNTFFGSSNGYDNGKGIAVDSSGNVYVTGYSNATWGSPLNAFSGNSNINVLKMSPEWCTATLDNSLSLNVPYISSQFNGLTLFSAIFVYDPNPTYPTLIPFKFKELSIVNNESISCEPSTLASDLTIHISDILFPDKITHIWADLTYSPVLSTDGNYYWIVSNYGEVTN